MGYGIDYAQCYRHLPYIGNDSAGRVSCEVAGCVASAGILFVVGESSELEVGDPVTW